MIDHNIFPPFDDDEPDYDWDDPAWHAELDIFDSLVDDDDIEADDELCADCDDLPF
jgi:hypothetical protein